MGISHNQTLRAVLASVGSLAWNAAAQVQGLVPGNDARIAWMGRTHQEGGLVLSGYPGVTLRVRFEGSGLRLLSACDSPDVRVAVRVDGGLPRTLRLPQGDSDSVLAEGLGVKVGRTIRVEEAGAGQPRPQMAMFAEQARASTPIEPGDVFFDASVSLWVELVEQAGQ